jgi:SPP1 family predicted phage head-tail adaptor
MTVKAGSYNRILVLEQEIGTTRGTYNNQVENWQPLVTVWAAVEPLSGRELLAAQQITEQVSHRLRTRYHPNITLTGKLRGKLGTRLLNIHTVIDKDEAHIELEMLATEVI